MPKQMIYLNLGLVVATIIALIYFVGQAKLKASKDYQVHVRRKAHNKFILYFNNFITRGSFRRVVEMYTSMSCYDQDTVKIEAVKLFERNIMIMIVVPIISFVIMRDVIILILMAFMVFVYYNSVIERAHDKLYMKIMQECSMIISSVREHYLETDSIPLAILYADKSKYLEVPMAQIYRMLTDTDGKARLDKFQRMYPVPIIKTFANTCYVVNEYGATKKDDGFDSFESDMLVLRQECDSEIRFLTKQRIAFNSLQNLSLVGLIIMPAFEWYLLKQIPGTASLIKGFYGLVSHILIILGTIYSYWYISTACRPSVVNQVDRFKPITDLHNEHKHVRDFIENILPKKFKTRLKLKQLIDGALSSQDFKYIYTSKVVYALCTMVIAFILILFGTIGVRDSFYNNYDSLSFIPSVVTETQYNQIVRMDNEFMELSQAEYEEYDDELLTTYVTGRITGISTSNAAEQVKRLRTKYDGYHSAHYYWWWWLIIYGAGVGGWFAPEILLRVRKKLVNYEASRDVAQLQTMMIVLSETKMDVYKALTWLEKQAAIHKSAIRLCKYSYIANPIVALNKLEAMSPINDFKRLVRKLRSCVYKLSLSDAFSDMALDKAQTLAITEVLRAEELELRKNNAKLIAIIPAGLALVGCFIGPVLVLGITEMMDTLNNLSGFGK